MRFILSTALALAVALAAAGTAVCSQEANPLAPPDTSSPRSTLSTFRESLRESYRIITAVRSEYFASGRVFPPDDLIRRAEDSERLLDHAGRCFDLSLVPPRLRDHAAIESALQLQEILDRIAPHSFEEVPGAAEIEALERGRNEPFRWRIPGTDIDISRVTEGPRTGEFLFSPEAVKRIQEDYKRVRELPYHEGATKGFYAYYARTPGKLVPPEWLFWVVRLPAWTKTMYAGQTLWQWAALGLTLLVLVAVTFAAHRWSRRIEPAAPLPRLLRKLITPLAVIVGTSFAGLLIGDQFNITDEVQSGLLLAGTLLRYLMGIWAALILGKGVAEWIISSPQLAPTGVDASLVRLLCQIFAMFVAVFLFAQGARELGVPLSAVVAGLGVGGLALGLAARSPVENIIGSISLFADRPIRVGDFCRYGDHLGWVEAIGLRSTRLRGVDQTLTTIPNSEFASTHIQNYTKRDRILLYTELGLRYETTEDQLRFVLVKMRELLLAHPRIATDSISVRFVGFGDSALQIELQAHATTVRWTEFIAIREELLLGVVKIVRDAGSDFAFRSNTTYFTRDPGLDRARGERAEEQVQAWRAAGTLAFSESVAEQVDSARDTKD